MSLQFNQLIVAGNLARDPEVRFLSDKVTVCNFAVATNRRWKGDDGEVKEETTFIECQAWRETADFIAGHFTKGQGIHVLGRLKQETWTDKEEKRRSRLVMIVDRASFTTPPKEAKPPTDAPAAAAAATANGRGGDEQPPF